MSYAEFHPSAALRPWVQCYWTRDASAITSSVRILPDGCADLLFELSGSAESVAVGTMTRPLILNASDVQMMFGIRFQPGRAGLLFRMPVGLITDLRVDITDVARGAFRLLGERIATAPSTQRRIDVVEEALLGAIWSVEADRRVDAAVRLILAKRGICDIEEIADRAAVSRQHLARLFGSHVGLTPKTFARVTRFRYALSVSGRKEVASWSDVAAHAGYYDQSHLIADFREFAGATPVPFFLSSRSGHR